MEAKLSRSLKLLQVEAVLTSVVFAMPILNLFFAVEIGMSLEQVGLSQAIFTASLMILNIPTGWLADRFSRKACNIAGDMIAASGFVYYAFAQSFADVVIAELILGVGLAFSGGADVGLLKAYCKELKRSYEQVTARIARWRPIAEMAAVTFGGILGAQYPRLTILLSGMTYLSGAILSWFLVEAGERRKNTVHPLKDMARIVVYALHGHRRLRWSILAYAFSRESTHALIWILTPLLIFAGVPPHIVGVAWALNLVAVWCGAQLAGRLSMRYGDWQLIAIGCAVFIATAAALSVHVNIFTVALYVGFGFARGWFSVIMPPIVQKHTPDDMQSTVWSLSGTVAQALYIPVVWYVGKLGDTEPRMAVLGSLMIFTPLLALSVYKIRRLELGERR